MNYLRSAIAASLMLWAMSCGNKSGKEARIEKMEETTVGLTMDTSVFAAPPQHDQEERKKPDGTPASRTEWDKKIIRKGSLTVEVDDYRKYNDQIHQLTGKWEAYIAREQENATDDKITNELTIKIPVQYFDEAVRQLSGLAGKLKEKQIDAQDVTGEYLDTRARMEAKKRVRLRYLDMLQKAKNMEEILQVEREVNDMQEEIEAAEGRVRYLSHSAAYSTIELTFYQVLPADVRDNENPGFGKRILAAFGNGLTWVSELMIILITLWPLWLGVGMLLWTVKKIVSMKSAKPSTE